MISDLDADLIVIDKLSYLQDYSVSYTCKDLTCLIKNNKKG